MQKHILSCFFILTASIAMGQAVRILPDSAIKPSTFRSSGNPQQATTFKTKWMVEVNPTLILTGEEGLMLKVQPDESYYCMLGIGYNTYTPSSVETSSFGSSGYGYTIRAGIMFPVNEKENFLLGIQGFFRTWQITHAIGTDSLGTYMDDYYINFSDALLPGIGGGQPIYAYNATINVVAVDLMFDKQVIRNHFVFDFYWGIGGRSKTINMEYLGHYFSSSQPTPFTLAVSPSSISQTTGSIDVKLGVMLGYRF